MRLWSIDFSYLDSKGLVVLWREGLLAKNVLLGNTVGYKNHPQLLRFKHKDIKYINLYLFYIYEESCNRRFKFDCAKIGNFCSNVGLFVTEGQLEYEFNHLQNKLRTRNTKQYEENKAMYETFGVMQTKMFKKIKGTIEPFEVVKI